MIILTLLHPTKTIPLQHWTFEDESIIRIGRGIDNNVVLYSAVVSRHHLELRKNGSEWELESFGANGTFIEGKLITTPLAVDDGMVIRLASSGPKIQISIKSQEMSSSPIITQTPTESSLEKTLEQDLQAAKD
ncbi:FHA domain-containing protein [Gloeothece verrucosa]|uniref:FHA domain-containing protein n=1 Tax=Gloeothece verrucosa TaxID=2546359 RepID=UPI0005A4EFC0|nr:FHA domain-containing protein [Gloeothece verrucosa]